MNKEDKAKKRAEILAECEARRKEAMEEIMKCGDKEIITVPAGRTYYYDGKFAVQTTKPHTSNDRYVTLRLIEGSGNVYILHREDYSPSRLHLFDYVYLSHGTEFWGEIDRCHMIRKTPLKTNPHHYFFGDMGDLTHLSQTSRGKKSFNEMK